MQFLKANCCFLILAMMLLPMVASGSQIVPLCKGSRLAHIPPGLQGTYYYRLWVDVYFAEIGPHGPVNVSSYHFEENKVSIDYKASPVSSKDHQCALVQTTSAPFEHDPDLLQYRMKATLIPGSGENDGATIEISALQGLRVGNTASTYNNWSPDFPSSLIACPTSPGVCPPFNPQDWGQ